MREGMERRFPAAKPRRGNFGGGRGAPIPSLFTKADTKSGVFPPLGGVRRDHKRKEV